MLRIFFYSLLVGLCSSATPTEILDQIEEHLKALESLRRERRSLDTQIHFTTGNLGITTQDDNSKRLAK